MKTPQELADSLDLPVWQIYRWKKQKKITYIKTFGGNISIPSFECKRIEAQVELFRASCDNLVPITNHKPLMNKQHHKKKQ